MLFEHDSNRAHDRKVQLEVGVQLKLTDEDFVRGQGSPYQVRVLSGVNAGQTAWMGLLDAEVRTSEK